MPDPSRWSAWQRAVAARLSAYGQAAIRRISSLGIDENTILLVLALAIGAAAGVAVIVFYELIDLTQRIALTTTGSLPGLGRLSIFVVVLGGLALARALVATEPATPTARTSRT
jgi:hypothetical protein